MKADPRFSKLPLEFWAHVRTISEDAGYSKNNSIKIPTVNDMISVLIKRQLNYHQITEDHQTLTDLGQQLSDYFEYRADLLNNYVKKRLMTADQARLLYENLHKKLKPRISPLPTNKQAEEKQQPNYFTGIINMLIEANVGTLPVNYDPKKLTTVTRDGMPLRTLARRLDGAFPSTVNPIATWEIKEYYYTTTFGSKVSDAIYVTFLDGMELQELRANTDLSFCHYLMIDAHDAWWNDGKSYLCRIVDLLNMGYADEVLAGHEVIERLPDLVKEWVWTYNSRNQQSDYTFGLI
jgi:hypothetical protein